MDSSNSAAPLHRHCRRHHHHHHHGHHHFFYVSPHCPLHRPLLQPSNHSPLCSLPNSQNPLPVASIPPNPSLSFTDLPNNATFDDSTLMQDEIEKLEVEEEEEEEEEEEDPIFVLTDEWREFFAKSEAKRRQAKKQAKKKGKI
ncbi:hypothetical protein ACJIZ3_017728 [Penstemon smallii]|uniref:Uncharacterized protein n=1 Tax=Penstemon smallii TaxID=265156 RepID=A0ABD3SX66_9LAMI